MVALTDNSGKPPILIYRHSDGYPDGVEQTVRKFLSIAEASPYRDDASRLSPWLLLLGTREYSQYARAKDWKDYDDSLLKHPFGAYNAPNIEAFMGSSFTSWKAGSYEPSSCVHWDIEWVHIVNTSTLQWSPHKVTWRGDDNFDRNFNALMNEHCPAHAGPHKDASGGTPRGAPLDAGIVALVDSSGWAPIYFHCRSDAHPGNLRSTIEPFLSLVRNQDIRDNAEQAAGWLSLLSAQQFAAQVVDDGGETLLNKPLDALSPDLITEMSGATIAPWDISSYALTSEIPDGIEWAHLIDVDRGLWLPHHLDASPENAARQAEEWICAARPTPQRYAKELNDGGHLVPDATL